MHESIVFEAAEGIWPYSMEKQESKSYYVMSMYNFKVICLSIK